MKGIDPNYFLMDAGSVRWSYDGGFGTALGQLRAQLDGCGRVIPAADLAPGDLPACATPCDFVVLRRGLLHWGYVTVRLEHTSSRSYYMSCPSPAVIPGPDRESPHTSEGPASTSSYLVTFQASARRISARILRDILARL